MTVAGGHDATVTLLSDSRPEFDLLVEREDELATLEAAFAEVSARRGRVALVTAEAGGGKTALIERFCAGRARSTKVLRGACDALVTPRPLGPIHDFAAEVGPDFVNRLVGDAAPYEVAGALIEELRRHETVLVVEDLHWSDEATLDVLRLLARRIGTGRVLLVLSYRDEALGPRHPVRVMLGELASGLAPVRLELAPLSSEAVAQLARPYDVDARDLYRLTAGNPFFVTEVLASGTDTMPSTVRDAVLARAARLTESARALIDAVAIVPPSVEPWLLEELAGEHVSGLRQAFSSGMLIERQGAIEFRHELGRLAVEQSLEPGRRLALHRRALAALAAHPAGAPDVARLAYHADMAADVEAVLQFAPAAAARAASLGAHREAAGHYARALRFGDGLEGSERAHLLEQRSRACYLSDDIDQAIESAEQALALRRTLGETLEEGRLLCWLAEILWCPGRTRESAEAARRAVTLLETLPPGGELALAYSEQGSPALGERAVALARELGDTELLVTTLDSLGGLVFADGGKEKLEEALALARGAGLHRLVGRVMINLAAGAIGARQYAVAAEYVEDGAEYCSEHGLELYRFYGLAHRARIELDVGRWDEAAETASDVLRIHRASILPRIWGLVVLALARARRGDPGHRDLIEEAWSLAEPTDEMLRMRPVAAARAEIAWLEGDRAGVEAATDRLLARAVESEDGSAAGELLAWRRHAGIDDADLSVAVPQPYAAELSHDWALSERIWSELGCPYEAALALAGADEEEPLRRALDRLQRLGARPAATIVARRLRGLGVRAVVRGPRQSTLANPAALTAREVDVLRLLSDGLRNAAIAERLFVSPRTVEHHVSAILDKLAVQSRGEAVAEAGRRGLLHAS